MYDLILRGGLVVDGSGDTPYYADVCIKDGRISCITRDTGSNAEKVIDVAGRVVAPGFIDIHTHSDASPMLEYITESKIAQGVTTEITGNCGRSHFPATPESLDHLHKHLETEVPLLLFGKKLGRLSVSDYAADAEKAGVITNFGNLIGHSTLRSAVMGYVNRDPTSEEMEQLKSLLDRELTRGAYGMSLGLIYPPSAFSSKEELVELAKVLKKHDALLTVHMRNEGSKVFEATEEMLSIAEESGVHLQISHLKLMGKPQWGRSQELLTLIENAQARGVNVTCDQYPFIASSTSLTAVLPNWAHEGGYDALIERLKNPTDQLKADIKAKVEERGGAHTILLASTNSILPQYEGKFISEIAQIMELDPIDTIIKVLLEAKMQGRCSYFCMDEADMLHIMQQDYVCVGSDGYAYSYEEKYTPNNPHPRNFGTFPQFFQTIREKELMSIEKAVHRATGLPAKFLGLRDRGLIKEGYAADITVFDADKIENLSTYIAPKIRPAGIDYVIVNGKVAMDHNILTKERAGKILLHS